MLRVQGGEFVMTRTGKAVPTPRPGKLQAVLWDGQEEHATRDFITGAARRHSMATLLTRKTKVYHQGPKAAKRERPDRASERVRLADSVKRHCK